MRLNLGTAGVCNINCDLCNLPVHMSAFNGGICDSALVNLAIVYAACSSPLAGGVDRAAEYILLQQMLKHITLQSTK